MIIEVTVIPNSSFDGVVTELNNGIMKVKLQAPAIDGKANSSLIKLLFKYFKTNKRNISIVNGEKSHKKLIEIKQN